MKNLLTYIMVIALSVPATLVQAQNCGSLKEQGEAYLSEREQDARIRILANMLCPETHEREKKSRDRIRLQEVMTAALTEALDIREFNPYQAEELGSLAVSLYFAYDKLKWMDEGEHRDIVSLICDFMNLRTDKFYTWQDRVDFGPTYESLSQQTFGKEPDIKALVEYGNAFQEQFKAMIK